MRHILTLFLLLFSTLLAFGQSQETYELNGTVVDQSGQPLEGVSVSLTCDTLGYKAFTDDNGHYSLKYKAAGPCTIKFSKAGYKESGGTMQPQPVTTINPPLERDEKTINLKEVTVEGNRIVANGNKTSYLPDKKQRNASHDGLDLLFRLAIPQLDVNPMTGSVSAVDRTNVAFYIEHRKVTLTDIGQLRAKDIKRVEYYENAADLFPGEQKVLNYVLYHYEAGGYVDASTDTRLIDRSGQYNLQLSLDKNKVNYLLLGGMRLSKDDGLRTEQRQSVFTSTPFIRTVTPHYGVSKNRNYTSLFRTTYNTTNTTLLGQFGIFVGKYPGDESSSTTEYTPAVYPSSEMSSLADSRNTTYSGHAFLRHNFDSKNSIDWQVTYSYSDNNYHRSYSESAMADVIRNDTKEHLNNFESQLTYRHRLNAKSSLSLFVWETYMKSNSRYLMADGENRQNLMSNELQFYPTYQVQIGNDASLDLQAGFDISSYKANDNKRTTKVWPRPVLTFIWMVTQHHRLALDARMGSTYPTLNTFSEASQRVNYFEVVKGNPLLGTTRIVDAVVSHTLIEKNFQISAFVGYRQLINVLKSDYFTDGPTLVHTYQTNGDYYSVDAGFMATLFLFNRSLQLKGGTAFHHQSLTGSYAAHYNRVSYQMDVLYYYKNFNAYAFFRPAEKRLYTTPAFLKSRPSYGMAVGWSGYGLKTEIGARNVFSKSKPYHQYYDYGCYAFDSWNHSDAYGPQVYLKLSYSFDFGRKIKHEQVSQGNVPQSGILRP